MALVSKLSTADKESLAELYASKGWATFVRIFGDNRRDILRKDLETTNDMDSLRFTQGQITETRLILKLMKDNYKQLQGEQEDVEE